MHKTKRPSILLICVYLGKPPEWMDVYLRSCGKNPDVDWLIMTDWERIPKTPPNVSVRNITRSGLEALIRKKIGIKPTIKDPYKICDYKPLYGTLFSEDASEYDFWGFTDLDMIYGNIRRFVTDEVLRKHDVISTCKYYCTGHFTLIRNSSRFNNLYRMNRYYREILQSDGYAGFDELGLTEILMREGTGNPLRWYHENIHAGAFDNRYFSSKVNEMTSEERKDYDFKNVAKWESGRGYGLESCLHGPCIWTDGNLRHEGTGEDVMYLHFNDWSGMSISRTNADTLLVRKEMIMGLSGKMKKDRIEISARVTMHHLRNALRHFFRFDVSATT